MMRYVNIARPFAPLPESAVTNGVRSPPLSDVVQLRTYCRKRPHHLPLRPICSISPPPASRKLRYHPNPPLSATTCRDTEVIPFSKPPATPAAASDRRLDREENRRRLLRRNRSAQRLPHPASKPCYLRSRYHPYRQDRRANSPGLGAPPAAVIESELNQTHPVITGLLIAPAA